MRGGHEADVEPVSPAGLHPARGQRPEGLIDLAGVAQVVVQHQRHQLHRGPAETGEEPLVLVGEDEDAALLLVAQRTQDRLPPGVGEVLGLVDHHRVEAVTGRQLAGLLGHQPGQSVLPELAVVAGAHLDAPQSAQVLVGADERGPVLARPGGGLALEVLGQTDRVADQGHPLRALTLTASAGQVLGLLQRQYGLAAARSPAHLDPAQQPGDLEDRQLLLGQAVGLGRALFGVGVDVVRRVVAPGEDLGDQRDVVVVGRRVVVGQPPAVVADALGQVILLVAVVEGPAGELGDREVVAELAVRQDHPVGPGDVAAPAPARIGLDVAAQRVLGVPGLVDGPAALVLASSADPPTTRVVPDRPALDLQDEDPELGHQHQQVGLVVLVLVGEADVGHQDAVGPEALTQPLPDLLLRRRGEGGLLGHTTGGHESDPRRSGLGRGPEIVSPQIPFCSCIRTGVPTIMDP